MILTYSLPYVNTLQDSEFCVTFRTLFSPYYLENNLLIIKRTIYQIIKIYMIIIAQFK